MDLSCRLLHGQPKQPFEWNYFPLLTRRIVLSNKERSFEKIFISFLSISQKKGIWRAIYMSGGTYSSKSTSYNRCLGNFSWQFYLLSEYLQEDCWKKVAERDIFSHISFCLSYIRRDMNHGLSFNKWTNHLLGYGNEYGLFYESFFEKLFVISNQFKWLWMSICSKNFKVIVDLEVVLGLPKNEILMLKSQEIIEIYKNATIMVF